MISNMSRTAGSRFTGIKYFIIASILLLAASCSKNQSAQTINNSGQIISFSIEPSQKNGLWTVYSDGAVAKVMAKNVKAVEVKYEPVLTETGAKNSQVIKNNLPIGSLGQMISLSSDPLAWALPMPTASSTEGFISPHVWVEATGLDGKIIKGPDLGGVSNYEPVQKYITKEKAVDIISNLAEVKSYILKVKQNHGDPHVGVDGDSPSISNEGIEVWTVRVYEIWPEGGTLTFNWYDVNANTGEVFGPIPEN